MPDDQFENALEPTWFIFQSIEEFDLFNCECSIIEPDEELDLPENFTEHATETVIIPHESILSFTVIEEPSQYGPLWEHQELAEELSQMEQHSGYEIQLKSDKLGSLWALEGYVKMASFAKVGREFELNNGIVYGGARLDGGSLVLNY